MKVQVMAGTRTLSGEPPRSTAYYYADLERLKRKEPITEPENHVTAPVLVERRTTNDVIDDVPIREVPPLRDRQWSLPEYHTPENSRKEETYSTAGTFPMPEPREKEPLLAELEIVGRLPLTQLESSSTGVRRSRSWYLCCPNVPDEEISRESSWRYSSLRPVTAPPVPGQNGLHTVVATQSSGRDDAQALRAERDALARTLAAERARAAAAARAHDARLAELHGVIAELVRRRAADKHAHAIPEEELSDECESTTQPAGDLDDADRSRTEQNDTSSALSPDLPTPQDKDPHELPEDTTNTSTQEPNRCEQPRVHVTTADHVTTSAHVTSSAHVTTAAHEPACDDSLHLSERDSELCLNTARCCQYARHAHSGGGGDSCEREHGSAEGERVCAPSPGRCESRQAKVASRVRLRKTEDTDSNQHLSNDEGWMREAAERLALDVCAQAELREALVAAAHDGSALSASVSLWRARCARLEADCRVLQCALARATDTAHRLSCACAVQESSSVALCCALRAADRALETYDVLLALAETQPGDSAERQAAEAVAAQQLSRLAAHEPVPGPLLSPGPWADHTKAGSPGGWSPQQEAQLRAHAARLKAETVSLRNLAPPPGLFSYHDIAEDELPKSVGAVSMADMEAAVIMQELLSAREARALRAVEGGKGGQEGGAESDTDNDLKVESSRRRRPRHWLDTPASETDL